MTHNIKQIAIIGCGHIGSSVLLSVEKHHPDIAIHVVEKNEAYREILSGWKSVSSIRPAIDHNIINTDLVIIGTHLSSYEQICKDLNPHLKENAIVTDVGSNKTSVSKVMHSYLPSFVNIIPGHPVAGTEHSGPMAGSNLLFNNRYVILTPGEQHKKDALEALKTFWEAFEAKVVMMTPVHHDRVLAMTSHIPHLIAYTLVSSASVLEASLKEENTPKEKQITTHEVIKFSAGGFRDATRIASSNPDMWSDVLIDNGEFVLEMVGRFCEELMMIQKAIRSGDRDMLKDLFNQMRSLREQVIEMHQAGHFIAHEKQTSISNSQQMPDKKTKQSE